MDMIFILLIIVLLLWNSVVTYFLYTSIKHYNDLTKGMSKFGLREILERVLRDKKEIKDRVVTLESGLTDVASRSQYHIQKIGIHRFNPFEDTGGSQSFTIAFLNRFGSGLVMTSLHARTGNRWYVKDVCNNKGVTVELSKEELKAVKEAKIYLSDTKE